MNELKKLAQEKTIEELEEITKSLTPQEQLLLWLYALEEGKVKTDKLSHISVYIPKPALPALRYIATPKISRFIVKALIELLEKN